MPLQKEGVILAAEGADKFIADLRKATDQYEQFIGQLTSGESKTARMGGGLLQMGKAAGLAKGALGILGGGALAATAAIGGAAAGVGFLAKKLGDLAAQTAPIEGIARQFDNLTSSIEGGTTGMLSALSRGASGMVSNRELMRSFNDAASLVNVQFAQRLPEAMGLLGKVSAATGTDLNYLLNSLVVGVGRVSPMILDNLKIQVSVAEATAKASEMFGKEADALSKVEQQTALTELALAKLEEKYGALPDISQTAVAQQARMQANLKNISDTLGQFLLPAWTTFLDGVNQMIGSFSMAISEGGSLYPILVQLGGALALLADGFKWVAQQVGEWLADMSSDWNGNLGQMVADAVQWGAELVSNFATGIIDAANTVLTEAMNYISNLLTYWLAPGSPPRVAPGLEKWGISAFESYLKGMTEADFGVLESVQGPLQKVLSGPAFADVSKAMAEALSSGDRGGALNILAESSKQFGDDIAELARREFALADAVSAVEDAERRLTAAQEAASRAQKQVGVETLRYNEMLRSGASEDALKTQLARINAAQKEAAAARQEATTAEAGIDAAKSRVDTLKEQVDWQQRFLNQLFGINDALSEEEKREQAAARATAGVGKAAAGKGGAVIPGLPEMPAGGIGGGIGGRIAAAIEEAKGQIKTALGNIWGIIQTELVEKWNTAIDGLGQTWEEFKTTVGNAWDALKEKYPILQEIEDWLVDMPGQAGEAGAAIRDKLHDAWSKFSGFVTETLIPALIGEGSLWASLVKIWDYITQTLIPAITGEDGLGPALQWLQEKVIDPLSAAWVWLKQKVDEAKVAIDNIVKAIVGVPKWLIGGSPSPLAIGIQTAADALENLSRVNMGRFPMGAMTMQPAGASFYRPAATTYNTRNINLQVGPNSVSGGMDAAVLTQIVRRVLRQELQ